MLPPTDVDSKVHNTDLFTLQTGENQWHRCTIHDLETNWILLLFPNIHHNTLWKPWLTSDRKTSESWTLVWLTFRVEPLGPMSRCLRFTNRSLLLTIVPILMMSQAMSSCNILTAWRQQHITEVSKSLHHSEWQQSHTYSKTLKDEIYMLCMLQTGTVVLPVQMAHSSPAA